MECVTILLEKSECAYSEEEKLALATRKNGYYKEQLENLDSSALLPGVEEFLKELKHLGIRMATGSSSKNAATLLEKTGIADYFEVKVDGNDISHSKPNPEVFTKAVEALGIKPENTVVLEDAEAGIQAAKAAFCKSIALGHIAASFLELGADAGAWGLDKLQAKDLDALLLGQ